jgi:hypothetical protein
MWEISQCSECNLLLLFCLLRLQRNRCRSPQKCIITPIRKFSDWKGLWWISRLYLVAQ